MRILPLISGLAILFHLSACKTTAPPETPNPGEKLIWSTEKQRPPWTYTEAEVKGDRVAFMAVSDKYSTEKYARDDAEQAARKKAVQFSSTKVRSLVKNVIDQVGKGSQTIDPGRFQREYERQLSEGGISQLKSKSWYLEKWQDPQGAVYWKAFVLAEIPKSVLDESLARVIRAETSKLQAQKEKATDLDSKAVLDAMMQAFEDIEKNGLSLD
ncbi:hypothetical protein HY522_12135 [bacterium]|nr:hypothetical protein [bacterium]